MSEFKRRHYHGTVILQCVRWYCKYGISYRDFEEMMEERGVEVDYSILYRWVQRYATELEKKLQWYKRHIPVSITSGKAPTYGETIRELKAECIIPNDLLHRQIK